MFKSRLHEYTQKNSLALPVYNTTNDGEDHLPQFKCSVIVNSVKYDSPLGFKCKREAENAAAQAAIEDLLSHGLELEFEESNLLKNMLSELASTMNVSLPSYQFTKEGDAHCPTFTATVEINGVSYTGAPRNNKKAAARKASYEAIRAINARDCVSCSQQELGKPNINDTNVGLAPIEQHQQDLIVVEQHQLKGDLYEDMELGSRELEGEQQGNDEVVLTESIGKRSRREYENAEQKPKTKSKAKRNKNRGTA